MLVKSLDDISFNVFKHGKRSENQLVPVKLCHNSTFTGYALKLDARQTILMPLPTFFPVHLLL